MSRRFWRTCCLHLNKNRSSRVLQKSVTSPQPTTCHINNKGTRSQSKCRRCSCYCRPQESRRWQQVLTARYRAGLQASTRQMWCHLCSRETPGWPVCCWRVTPGWRCWQAACRVAEEPAPTRYTNTLLPTPAGRTEWRRLPLPYAACRTAAVCNHDW